MRLLVQALVFFGLASFFAGAACIPYAVVEWSWGLLGAGVLAAGIGVALIWAGTDYLRQR